MTKIHRAALCLLLVLSAVASCAAQSTSQPAPQTLLLQGLLSANHRGSFTAAQYGPDGSLYLLLDEGDGIRVLKADAMGSALQAQWHIGSAGDSGVALSLDPSGNVYVTGTSSSGALYGSSGVPFPSAADTTVNSFVAKLDPQLKLLFLSFLGAGRTAVTGIAATANAVYLTGVTFSSALPVTPSAFAQSPASGSSENGFAEAFSSDGSVLRYATYLTGANGNTEPAAIVADTAGHAFVTGETSASGFPTIAALQPATLGSVSGFLTELTPAGDGIVFSTFIAGSGITGLALDASSSSLLLTGAVALGQFPVASVDQPLTSAVYQSLLRIPTDGQSVTQGVVLAPATQSSVAVAPDGSAWITMPLTTPLLPSSIAAAEQSGDGLVLHVLTSGQLAQGLRVGGAPVSNAGYAALSTLLAAPAIAPNGTRIAVPGTVSATVSAALLSSERFDLSLVAAPNALLPESVQDLLPGAPACGSTSQCSGSAALLALLDPTVAAPSLALASGDLPALTIRNLGAADASGLTVSASGYSVASDCASTLAAGAQCGLALSGAGPGTISISATGMSAYTTSLPSTTASATPLALSASELDFGIVSATSGPVTRSLTISNLGSNPQSFTVAADAGPATTAYSVALVGTTCTQNASGQLTLEANASCNVSLALTAANKSSSDGPVHTIWSIASHDVILTGFSQAVALSLSASQIDFGTQSPLAGALRLPRHLFLSNNSVAAVAHSPVILSASSPFSIADECPTSLQPQSVCRLTLNYNSATAPSIDSATLALDQGLSVLLTGKTLSPQGASGSAADPNVAISPSSLTFTDSVTVTELSANTQGVQIRNTGATAVPLAITLTGDFVLQSQCPATLGAGATCELLISFAPSQPGPRDGLLSISVGGGFSPSLVALSGTATSILSANNGTLALGSGVAGEPLIAWYPVQVSLPSLTVSSGNPAFTLALAPNTGASPPSLPASAFSSTVTSICSGCWLGVQFLSGTAGPQTGTLTLSTVQGGNPEPITLTASAAALSGLVLSPSGYDYGTVSVHSTTAPAAFTLANMLSPSAIANIQSVTATGDFSIVTLPGPGACSGALAATASCSVAVSFAPSATGARNGILTIITDQGTASATLTGYGSPDPGIAFTPSSLVFTNSAATQQTVTITNTGTASITIGAPSIPPGSFTAASTCSTLAPGAQCAVGVTYTPGDTHPQTTLGLPVTTSSTTPPTVYTVPLSATYSRSEAGLLLQPSVANLGATATGSLGLTGQFSLTNLTQSNLAIALTLPRQFPLAAPSSCATLAGGATCTFSVSFAPVTTGSITGTVLVTGSPTDGSAPSQALGYLLGYGQGAGTLSITGQSSASSSSVSFGQATSGQSVLQALTLTNTGTGPLSIHRISSQPPFLSTTTCGDILSPNSSCTVTLTYAPVYQLASGSSAPLLRQDAGTLTVESDALTSPSVLQLTGSVAATISGQPASSATLATYSITQSALTFPNTTVGDISAAQVLVLTNNGTATLHIGSVLSPADFTATSACTTLLPGDLCTIAVQFTPGDLSSSAIRSGTLEIRSDAADSLEFVTLLGSTSPAPLTLSPTSLNFGTVAAGKTAQLAVTLTNSGNSPITLGSISATAGYSVDRGTCPAAGASLAVGAQCTLQVSFTPASSGTQDGTLSVSSDATQLPLTVGLSGSAVAASLQVTPGALAFGSIAVGSPANLTITLLNAGTAPLSGISNTLSGANASDFAVTVPCPLLTLAPGQSCSETVTFTPSSTGARPATLNVSSSDPSSPFAVALSGSGQQAGSFTLTVSGARSSAVTVASGQPAIFGLTLTPSGGFTGPVALTCDPLNSAPYATCSLLASALTLSGGAQSSTATVNTIISVSPTGAERLAGFLFLPFTLLGITGIASRNHGRNLAQIFLVFLIAAGLLGMSGCGGHSAQSTLGNLRYTPAGTYQWKITASSTSGPAITSAVTITVTVQ